MKTKKADMLEVKDMYENYKFTIDFDLDSQTEAEYSLVECSFDEIQKSIMLWDMTSTKSVNMIKERSSAWMEISRTKFGLAAKSLATFPSKFMPLRNGKCKWLVPFFLSRFLGSSKQNNQQLFFS